MITPITATFPALNFPKEVDYPTQEDWAAFSAEAELNYGILSGEWSDKSEEFKAQANNLAQEIQDIGENAINAITFDNIAQLKLNSNMGRVDVLGYYTKGDGGGGIFYWDATSTEADNGGTIIQATGIPTGRWKRVFSGAVNVKWFGASLNQSASNNAIFIQSAVNNTPSSGCLIIDEYYNISSTITIPTLIKIKSLKKFNGGGLYGDIDGPLISKSGQMWINDFEGLILSNTSSSGNATCIQGTLYRCSIKYCTFTCPSGKALNLLGNDYCVENIIEKNYFTGCKYGIYAQSNTHSNTDSFIIDNYFWSGTTVSTTIENSIYWDTPSGCTFRGNHPYGGSQTGMIRLIAGINVSIIDNYFESSDNCRLRIDSGNPSSYTITGNKFWAGDGTKNDISGDTSNIIKLSFSAFNRANLTFTGNIFEGGTNNVIIFSLLNGNDTDSSNIKINFDKSNTIGGSYLLAQNAAGGTSTLAEKGVIESDHPEFFYFSTSQSLSPTSVVCSEFFQKASGFSIGYPTLPAGKSWLTNRQIKIHNISTNMTMSFSTGATGGITGNKATDVAKIFAGDSAILMIVDGNYFFMHDRS